MGCINYTFSCLIILFLRTYIHVYFGENKFQYMLLKPVYSTFAPACTWLKGDSFNIMLGCRECYNLVFDVNHCLLSFKIKGTKVPVIVIIAKTMEIEPNV
jgi:hypothetical protein